ncbi:MAG: AMP-binding protein [Acidimicrobiales bacterium]
MTVTRADTLRELLAAIDPANPRPFLLDADGDTTCTYADAARRSARFAHALAARGAAPGHRVAMQVTKSADALMVYLACVRAGYVLLPMNTGYTADEVAYLVGDARPSVVLDDHSLAALAADAEGMPDHLDEHPATPDDLAAILYTSGTTGKPKGAMLTQRNLASNSATLAGLWGFGEGDVLLHALPIFHTHGLFVATNCSIANGSPMVFLERFDADEVVGALTHCTVMMGVPTFYTRLLAHPSFDRQTCAGMRLFISGSAPLLASVHEQFHERTGHAILERYGMTETSMLTSNPLHGERRPGTVGLPLPDVDVRVVGEDGVALGVGGVGGVEVRGPNVFAGYWGRPELTATEFTADGWFRTGDVGTFDTEGYLHLVGRSKDLIITGGLNVYPKEIEDVVDALPGVLESAVIGVPDADFGEAVVAVVVARSGSTVDPSAVRLAAREHLAPFKVPKRVHVVDALPRNAMGKIEKAALRRQFAAPDGPDGGTT